MRATDRARASAERSRCRRARTAWKTREFRQTDTARSAGPSSAMPDPPVPSRPTSETVRADNRAMPPVYAFAASLDAHGPPPADSDDSRERARARYRLPDRDAALHDGKVRASIPRYPATANRAVARTQPRTSARRHQGLRKQASRWPRQVVAAVCGRGFAARVRGPRRCRRSPSRSRSAAVPAPPARRSSSRSAARRDGPPRAGASARCGSLLLGSGVPQAAEADDSSRWRESTRCPGLRRSSTARAPRHRR